MEIKKKTSEDRHFYLLAKGWYERNEIKKDLATIQARYCGLDFDVATVSELFIAAIDRMLMLVTSHGKSRRDLVRFISDFRVGCLGSFANNPMNFDEALAMTCLSKLSISNPSEIPFELGSPDETLLPLKK